MILCTLISVTLRAAAAVLTLRRRYFSPNRVGKEGYPLPFVIKALKVLRGSADVCTE